MKVKIGNQVVTVTEVSIILDSGHTLRIQKSGDGILIMSGNAHLDLDRKLSNVHQLRVTVFSPDTADVEEPPSISINELMT